MSEAGAGNPSTHGTAGTSGADAGSKVAGFFKDANKAGEELRGNINSFADNLFQKPSSATGNEASPAVAGGAGQSGTAATGDTHNAATGAHPSTGFSKDATAVFDAAKDSLNGTSKRS